jgi:hypothetical protein
LSGVSGYILTLRVPISMYSLWFLSIDNMPKLIHYKFACGGPRFMQYRLVEVKRLPMVDDSVLGVAFCGTS